MQAGGREFEPPWLHHDNRRLCRWNKRKTSRRWPNLSAIERSPANRRGRWEILHLKCVLWWAAAIKLLSPPLMDLHSAEGLVEIGQQDKCAMLSPAIVLAVAIKNRPPPQGSIRITADTALEACIFSLLLA